MQPLRKDGITAVERTVLGLSQPKLVSYMFTACPGQLCNTCSCHVVGVIKKSSEVFTLHDTLRGTCYAATLQVCRSLVSSIRPPTCLLPRIAAGLSRHPHSQSGPAQSSYVAAGF